MRFVLWAVEIYLVLGLLFALPFVTIGVQRIDAMAARAPWGFRVLILPGSMVFWPLLLRRLASGTSTPPIETNAHRRRARSER